MTLADRITSAWLCWLDVGLCVVQTGAVILAVVELVRGRPFSALAAVSVAWVARRVGV